MLKNETAMLDAWLQYHAQLFGIEHLYLLDNGSTDPETQRLLNAAAAAGASVDFRYSTPSDFTRKGERVLAACREIEGHGYDMLLPLDCDEFVAVESAAGQVSIDAGEVLGELGRHVGQRSILKIAASYDNSPSHQGLYFRVEGQSKCFFGPGVCGWLDIGFHAARSFEQARDSIGTRIAYIHHHFREWSDYVRSAREKLDHRLPDFSAEALRALVDRKGEGFHLAVRLLQGEAEYYARFDKLAAAGGGRALASFAAFLSQRGLLPNGPPRSPPPAAGAALAWRGSIDSVVVTQAQALLVVRGWAFHLDGRAAESLLVEVNGQPLTTIARIGHARPDVTRVYPAAPLISGYEMRCQLASDTETVQSVSVVVPDQPSMAGRRFEASQGRVRLQ